MKISGKRYKIKSRSRFTLFIALAIVFMVMASNTFLGLNDVSSLTERQYTEITVKSGDTLWGIAGEYMTGSGDIRKSVYTLCRINGISADELKAGQTLRVPVNGVKI